MRFYIDERGGCIAVRDKTKDCDSQGLHEDMDGVIAMWMGFKALDDNGMTCWETHDWQKEKAKDLCNLLLGLTNSSIA